MLQWSELTERDSVLDVACGRGELAIRISKDVRAICGADLSMTVIRNGKTLADREGVDVLFVVSDAHHLPFQNECFDKILCSSSLEYFDALLALREMRRVLRQNGRVVLTADSNTFFLEQWIREEFKKKNNNAAQFYSTSSLTKKFQEAGFAILQIQYMLNSRVSDFFYRLGILRGWDGYLWSIASIMVYYPCLISDSMTGSSDRGHTVIVQAMKAGNDSDSWLSN